MVDNKGIVRSTKEVKDPFVRKSLYILIVLFHETNGASSPIRFKPRKGTQAPHCLLFYLRNACKFRLRN